MIDLPPTRFWIKDTPGPDGIVRPAILQTDNDQLLCTYVPDDNSKPELFFRLKWQEVSGRYYDGGSRYPDSLTIITTKGKQYSFFRKAMVAKAKDFPEDLAKMAPDDKKFGKFYWKTNKTLVTLDNILKSHQIPTGKLAK